MSRLVFISSNSVLNFLEVSKRCSQQLFAPSIKLDNEFTMKLAKYTKILLDFMSKADTQSRRDILFIVIIYSLAFGIYLFNNGVFWDDWIFYQADNSNILAVLSEVGMPWVGYLLFLNKHIILYRILIFLCFLFAVLSFYFTLELW